MNVYHHDLWTSGEYYFFEIAGEYGFEVEISTDYVYFGRLEDEFKRQNRDFNPNKLTSRSKQLIINCIFTGRMATEDPALVKDMFNATE